MELGGNQSPIVHNHPAKPFPKGNKLGKGGKRVGAGRKSRKVIEAEQERVQTAREIYKAEQQKQARAVIDTYYRLAKSGRYPQATLHEIDKIDPDELVTAPTVTINFVMFNPSSSGNDARSIDVTPAPIQPAVQPPTIPASPTSPDGPRFTFLDITPKDDDH